MKSDRSGGGAIVALLGGHRRATQSDHGNLAENRPVRIEDAYCHRERPRLPSKREQASLCNGAARTRHLPVELLLRAFPIFK